MNLDEKAIARMLTERLGYERYEAEGLASRIAGIRDAELLEAMIAWMLTSEERDVARGELRASRLVRDFGFTYPNAIACLSQPERVSELIGWL